MPIDFRLQPPLSQDALHDNQIGTPKEVVRAMVTDIDVAMNTQARRFAKRIARSKADMNESHSDMDSVQNLYKNLQAAAKAYMAYRMGDVIALDNTSNDQQIANDQKAVYFRNFADYLEEHYGPQQARKMVEVITHKVDTLLEKYCPQGADVMHTASAPQASSHIRNRLNHGAGQSWFDQIASGRPEDISRN